MNSITKIIPSDIEGLIKKATLVALSMANGVLSVQVAYSYETKDGTALAQVDRTKGGYKMDIAGTDIPASPRPGVPNGGAVVSTAESKALYDGFLTAIEGSIDSLIDKQDPPAVNVPTSKK